jgi:hypothetical protein
MASPADSGADDMTDSDANVVTGTTPLFGPLTADDPFRWDAGMTPTAPCVAPDEAVVFTGISLDGGGFAVLHFQDPNDPQQVTGYDVYRTSDVAAPVGSWPLLVANFNILDPLVLDKEWTDTSQDVSPTGIWFYQITAFSSLCPAEGPF